MNRERYRDGLRDALRLHAAICAGDYAARGLGYLAYGTLERAQRARDAVETAYVETMEGETE